MTVSETLKKVANTSFYNPGDYMCLSLNEAYIYGFITKEERDEAQQSIRDFIFGESTMTGFLIRNGGSGSHQDKKAIYSDWDNRYSYLVVKENPTFWQKVKLFFKRNHHA